MAEVPLDDPRRELVRRRTGEFIVRSEELFLRRFGSLPVRFDLTGRAAGMYCTRGGVRVIRYNPYIFANQFEENLEHTVPHEVAHYVTDMLFGRRHVRPHGNEWQDVMRAFGVPPRVRGEMDLTGVPVRRYRKFPYRCDCRRHELTAIRHNRIARGQARYGCRHCGGWLEFAEASGDGGSDPGAVR